MQNEIIVVSGLPRSGTSMLMKMLEAGGIDLVTDNFRKADEDNPLGYFEYEKVKSIENDGTWLKKMGGKAVKIISHLLYHLPPDLRYKIIFVRRDMGEILTSQNKMYERLNNKADSINEAVLFRKFGIHLAKIETWLEKQENFDCLFLQYHEVVKDARSRAETICSFLDRPLKISEMAATVSPSLYRNRKTIPTE